jgi:hypothetical protein
MKLLVILAGLVFFLNGHVDASESTSSSNAFVLEQCYSSVLRFDHDKAYLNPVRLCSYDNQFFLQTDNEQWMPIEAVRWKEEGPYVDMVDALCPRGHVGIYRVKGTWYCNEESCPYSIGENFSH